MHGSARDRYLETEVMTASPQKLQLMLIDAAIRSIEHARRHWRAKRDDEASESLIRAQQIITELLSGLNHEVLPDLTKRVAAVYLFAFRRLIEANSHRDEGKLDEALRALEPQREAWEGVCEQLGSTRTPENETRDCFTPQESAPAPPEVIPPLDSASLDDASPGLSLEA